MSTKPSFIVVGAAKAGTTSVYRYLRDHPEVYMSRVKEPKYFALQDETINYGGPGDTEEMRRHSVTTLTAYEALFREAGSKIAVGEASTLYLYSDLAAQRMRSYRRDLKVVAFLRNPIDRAYSNFTYMVRRGREHLRDFEAALDHEPYRITQRWMPGWHYTRRGLYSEQLDRFYQAFPADQVRVYLYDDLRDDTLRVMKDLYGFIGVNSSLLPNISARHNVSGIPRSEFVHRLLMSQGPIKQHLKRLAPQRLRDRLRNRMLTQNLASPPKMTYRARERLIQVFYRDITKTQELIGRDLSHWLQ